MSERRGTTTTFSHSGLKNADIQSSVSQAVSATQQYDAFGNLASSTGTWQGQFGYGGGFGYQQDATGLKLLGHRYYDSSTGRFLTRDSIKDGRNWYVYCEGDPVGCADPTGLWSLWRYAYTGDGDATDDVYDAALDQAWDTAQKASKAALKHFSSRYGVGMTATAVTVGPIPKKIAKPIAEPFGIRFIKGQPGATNLIRIVSQRATALKPIANFVKQKHVFKRIWLVIFAEISFRATKDTWDDPEVWTMKAEL